jgi:hypothetical protein
MREEIRGGGVGEQQPVDVLVDEEVDADLRHARIVVAAASAATALVIGGGDGVERPGIARPASGDAKARPAGDGEERDADRNDSTERPVGAPLRKPNFQSSFATSLRKINSTPRELFADETPDLDKCRQGPLGNCYFVAAVGAYVHRDASDLKKMITPQKGGGYEVRFGSGEKVVVAPLTDAELALSGTTGDEGVWLPVLEKALGTLRREANPTKYAMETATDAIAGGGSSATIVRMLTGKQTERITLKIVPRNNPKMTDGKPVVVTTRPAGDLAGLAAQVRTKVGAALADKRLVTTGTGTEPQPPGISGKHAYAVLGYDAKTDRLRIWNPHGNTFRPKGEPGLKFGYPTAAGVFEVPVVEFVQIFRGVSFEKSGQ